MTRTFRTTSSSPQDSGETPRHVMECHRLKGLRVKHAVQAGRRVPETPVLQLASFLLELIRHAPRPHPATRRIDASASVLERDFERGLLGLGHAVHPSPLAADSETRMPIRNEEGQVKSVGRLSRFDGRAVRPRR